MRELRIGHGKHSPGAQESGGQERTAWIDIAGCALGEGTGALLAQRVRLLRDCELAGGSTATTADRARGPRGPKRDDTVDWTLAGVAILRLAQGIAGAMSHSRVQDSADAGLGAGAAGLLAARAERRPRAQLARNLCRCYTVEQAEHEGPSEKSLCAGRIQRNVCGR